ncbi:MAG: di-trans,poly-cis-decaprenylcistransferase [Actinobacteria bacterium]|nr:di-trans,poly-cis-decaprenylcistransferase [Actinomycetota bacterium]
MDGNGRWAENRFLPRQAGHIKGASILRQLVLNCQRKGIACVTIFAFSTENWSRSNDEVSALMSLFLEYLKKEDDSMRDKGVKLNVIGDISRFPLTLQNSIKHAMDVTAENRLLTLNIAANYGGRKDVLQAVSAWQVANPNTHISNLTESELSSYLSTAGLPDPDLLIRTGGEFRLSNFLLWQLAYTEIYVTDTLWPDFDAHEFDKALDWFAGRERRFGSVSC